MKPSLEESRNLTQLVTDGFSMRRLFVLLLVATALIFWGGQYVLTRHDTPSDQARAAALAELRERGFRESGVELLWVVDFSKPSYAQRGVFYKGAAEEVTRRVRVTHGSGSSQDSEPFATVFSNREGSHQSSLGLYRIGAIQPSQAHGTKIMLHGLERGINDKAAQRAIVIHAPQAGMNYLSNQSILIHLLRDGWLGIGRSQGCPVLTSQDYAWLKHRLETAKGDAFLYIYHPDKE